MIALVFVFLLTIGILGTLVVLVYRVSRRAFRTPLAVREAQSVRPEARWMQVSPTGADYAHGRKGLPAVCREVTVSRFACTSDTGTTY